MREDREIEPASACPPTGTEKMLRDLASVSGLVSVTLDGDRIHGLVKLLDTERERIRALEDGLEPFAEAWDVATHHKDVVAGLTMAQLGELAAHEVSGVHFRNARALLANTDKGES